MEGLNRDLSNIHHIQSSQMIHPHFQFDFQTHQEQNSLLLVQKNIYCQVQDRHFLD